MAKTGTYLPKQCHIRSTSYSDPENQPPSFEAKVLLFEVNHVGYQDVLIFLDSQRALVISTVKGRMPC